MKLQRWLIIMVLLHMQPAVGQSMQSEQATEVAAESLVGSGDGSDPAGDLESLAIQEPHGLRLNQMDRAALMAQLRLSEMEADALLEYRRRQGSFIDPMELQAVPGWSIDLVRRILPLVSMDTLLQLVPALRERLHHGTRDVLYRTGSVLERAIGYRRNNSGLTPFAGDPIRSMLRYRFSFQQSLSAGIRMEKDAGENWLTHRGVPDQLSAYLSLRDLGLFTYLMFGDFQVWMGQGLVQGQGLAFRKSPNTLGALRNLPVFKPHLGGSENAYHRGLAIGFRRKAIWVHAYLAYDRLDAHREFDSLSGKMVFTSLQTSGLHRTISEIRDRKSLADLNAGARVAYQSRRTWIGLNLVLHRFNGLFVRGDAPYALYHPVGSAMINASLDHHVGLGGVLMFGEWAVDRNGRVALTEGMVWSPDPRLDLLVHLRYFSPGYNTFQGSGFSEGSGLNNEQGIYMGMEWRPYAGWQLNAYIDRYRFPWLRYLVDAPSNGSDVLVRLSWQPAKSRGGYLQWGHELRPAGQAGAVFNQPGTGEERSNRIRLHYEEHVDRYMSLTFRMEMASDQRPSQRVTHGFLTYLDLRWMFPRQRISLSSRVVFFDTEGYDSRIYAYESMLPGMFSVPAFYGHGVQGAMVLRWRPFRFFECSFGLRRSWIHDTDHIGSGYDLVPGGRKTEWDLQIRSSL